MNRLEYLQAVKKLLPIAPVCAEIGVYRGDFSKMILEELRPSYLLLVDSWGIYNDDKYNDGAMVRYSHIVDYYHVKNIFKDRIDNNTATVFKTLSNFAASYYSEYLFDFIYIDADHRYESVKRDLEMWYKLLTERGYIGGHDYGNELFGVTRAVDEFCEEKKLNIVLLSDEGDFVLSKAN